MKYIKLTIIAFLALALALPFPAHGWQGIVTKIHDGDTITVLRADDGEQRPVKARLYGIDCPEYKQDYGQAATEFVRLLLPIGSRVEITTQGKDRYKRIVGSVGLPTGENLQELLLRAGYAWVYPQYCKGCAEWKRIEREARQERRGLWTDESPVPPWEWRKETPARYFRSGG